MPRQRPAEPPHRFRLYEQAVQGPEATIELFLRVFRRLRGRTPTFLREDFCGTAHLAASWVAGSRRRRALAIDLDPEPLAWGRDHNRAALPPATARRLQLLQADVRQVDRPRVDLTCALNFSCCFFDRRDELRDYFAAARRGLASDGLLVVDLYGGTEAIAPIEERRECEGFTYVWEQESYDPITHRTRCHIHFELPGGERLERAFTYDWRLWTVREMRELLAEVGFRASEVYWEATDDDGEGTGDYVRVRGEMENQEGWLVYIVGIR